MTKHNRLLVLGIQWPPETFLSRLIQGLRRRNIYIYVPFTSKSTKKKQTQANLNPVWIPSWNVPWLYRGVNLFRALFTLLVRDYTQFKKVWFFSNRKNRLITKIRSLYQLAPLAIIYPDVVYFPWVLGAKDYLEWYQTNNIPVITSLRGSMINIYPLSLNSGTRIKEDLQYIFSNVDRVHCVSSDILNEANQYGLDPEKAVIIHPAVDPTFFCPAKPKITHEIFRIVSTGSLIWRKGFEYALCATRMLIDRGINSEIIIIGDGPEKQRILYTIQDLQLSDHVRLLGKLAPSSVLNHLQNADAFLLSSLSEGISNAVLEAMSCALPVVTTDCGGMREAVTDGIEGFVVPIRDSTKMADRLIELASDPELRTRLGTAGRNRIIREFNIHEQVNAFNNFLKQITSIS